MPVTFHTEKSNFNLEQKLQHKRWIKSWIESRNAVCGNLSFIFTSNKQLRLINQEYLNHNYFTDVITFDYSEGDCISGEIYISKEQVRINALEYGIKMSEELKRVMIHGILHLLGYKDETPGEKADMSDREDEALKFWHA